MSQKLNDEYVWTNYTKEYSGQLKQIEGEDGQTFFITEFKESDGEIIFKDPLHPNWKELYAAVYDLKPESIFECGFGGCYHLKNISKILPDAKISGTDLLQTQMDFGVEFSKIPDSIKDNMCVMDFSQTSLKHDVGQHEFVYSQAVVMHLNTEKGKQFLKNMGKISSKYVFLMEGYKNHENFFDMVKECLPDFEFSVVHKHVSNCLEEDPNGPNFSCGILMTRKS
jgi:hypothetical protein